MNAKRPSINQFLSCHKLVYNRSFPNFQSLLQLQYTVNMAEIWKNLVTSYDLSFYYNSRHLDYLLPDYDVTENLSIRMPSFYLLQEK